MARHLALRRPATSGEYWRRLEELQHAQARLMRRVLDLHGRASAPTTPQRPTLAGIRRFLSDRRLPVRGVGRTDRYVRVSEGIPVPVPAWQRHSPGVVLWRGVCRIDCYTDGREEEATRARLAALLGPVFPRARFVIDFPPEVLL